MDEQDSARVKYAAAAAAVLVGGILVALALAGQSGGEEFGQGEAPPRRTTDLSEAAQLARCEIRDFPRKEGDGRTAGDVRYQSDPPHSGTHAPEPAQPGAYAGDPPKEEEVVHALRHGRIAIWFSDDLPDGDRDDLKALLDEDPNHMILLPDDTMPYEVAATAWTHRIGCEEMSPRVFDALRAFRDAWRDRGPEFVP